MYIPLSPYCEAEFVNLFSPSLTLFILFPFIGYPCFGFLSCYLHSHKTGGYLHHHAYLGIYCLVNQNFDHFSIVLQNALS